MAASGSGLGSEDRLLLLPRLSYVSTHVWPTCRPFPVPPLSPFQEWFNVYEHNRHTSCTVSDLIVGNEYYFRIFSENICGLSDSPGVSKNTARILKTGAGMPGTEL